MAADNRSIVITLKLDKSSDEASTAEQTNTDSASKKNDKDGSSKAVAAWAAAQVAQMITSEIVSWTEYYWDRNLKLSDDYIGQRNKNIAIMQVGRAIDAVGSFASSTAQGAMLGGGVGAVIGAVVGLLKVESGIIRSNLQGMDQQNIMLRQMDAQLQFTRSRVGWSLKAASIGEDL